MSSNAPETSDHPKLSQPSSNDRKVNGVSPTTDNTNGSPPNMDQHQPDPNAKKPGVLKRMWEKIGLDWFTTILLVKYGRVPST